MQEYIKKLLAGSAAFELQIRILGGLEYVGKVISVDAETLTMTELRGWHDDPEHGIDSIPKDRVRVFSLAHVSYVSPIYAGA